MAKRKPKFNSSTPKIVNIAFTYQGENYITGEPFPPEDVTIGVRVMRGLYNSHRLDNAPLDVQEVAVTAFTEPQDETPPVAPIEAIVPLDETPQEQTLFTDEQDDGLVELGSEGDAIVTKPWES